VRKDYYAILGLKVGASQDEIKEAYRTMAMRFHPDVNTTGKTHQPGKFIIITIKIPKNLLMLLKLIKF
jgi:DnaJ family protein B protein 4